jgi:alpha-tubulin suppressor-like RCC1 family protein
VVAAPSISPASSSMPFLLSLVLYLAMPPIDRAPDHRLSLTVGTAGRVTVLSGRTTWPAGARIALSGSVIIPAHATLSIGAGTVVEATMGTSIVVDRAGRLNVQGTPLQPVVFTCPSGDRVPGCWEGLTILGNAPINHGTATSPTLVREGAPQTGGCNEDVLDGFPYGGCFAGDSSGVLRYARVQYANTGLRVYGVGSATVLQHLQVHRSLGQGLDVDGGTARFKYLALTTNAHYGLQYAGGWTGQAQFVVIQQDPTGYEGGLRGRNAVFSGGNVDAAPRSAPRIANLTIIAPVSTTANPFFGNSPAALRIERGAAGQFYNVLLVEPSIGVDVDGSSCGQIPSGALSLLGVALTAPINATDPDIDSGTLCTTSGEQTLLQNATIVTGPTAASQLRSALNVVLPDLRPAFGSTIASTAGISPPASGVIELATFLGAVPSASNTGNNVPWYSGWTIGEQLASSGLITVSGTISGTGRGGIADLQIRIDPIGLTTTTDAFGAFTVSGVPAGPVEIVPPVAPIPFDLPSGCQAPTVIRAQASATASLNVQLTCTVLGPLPWQVTITTGDQHSCGIALAGTYCWGNNGGGQLGDGSGANRNVPTVVSGIQGFIAVAAGLSHTCGLTAAGEAYCWGTNEFGQLGDGTTTSRSTPTRVVGGQLFKSLVAGVSHTCGLTSTERAYCWGLNADGQLGDATTTNRLYPKRVLGTSSFTMVTAGWFHSCGRTSSGGVYCWGGNPDGQLGTGNTTSQAVPTLVSGADTYATVTAGARHTCALSSQGSARCWGLNNQGQLGDGSGVARSVPTAVSGGLAFASIATGYFHTCGTTPQKKAYCWGWNEHGQVGDATTIDRLAPVAVYGGDGYEVIARGGGYHTCGLQTDSLVSCWGQNAFGEVGDGSNTTRTTPTIVSGGVAIFKLAANWDHTCGLSAAGAAYCWGQGQAIGDGTFGGKNVPAAVTGGFVFSDIYGAAQGSHFCGRTSAGLAYCWGKNSEFELGDGTNVSRATPTAVGGGLTFSSLGGGFTRGRCALSSSGGAYCWGSPGGTGVLGDATFVARSAPGPVAGGLSFSNIASGHTHVCALGVSNDSAYCWGTNGNGQVGSGTVGNNDAYWTPSAVTGGLAFSALALGMYHSCGLTAAGQAYCWGYGLHGQLGDGSMGIPALSSSQPNPVPVSGSHVFTALAAGDSFTCGLTVSGAAYCWGGNAYGELGNGTFTNSLVPTPVIGGRSFVRLTAAYRHVCGSTATGAVFCWGWGLSGQLGGGSVVSVTSRWQPMQVRTGIAFRIP